MVEVVVFGSCMIDFISYVDHFPKPGSTIHSTSYDTGFGGKGSNQCIAAARLGCKTAMIGKIGSDPHGNKYKSQFEAEGVNTQFLEVAGEHSGVALIVVSSDGQNQIVINANANSFLSADDFMKAETVWCNAKILICQLETPLQATVQALTKFKGFSILNGAPAMKLSEEVLKLPSVLCINEHEAEEITGIKITNNSDAKTSIEELLRKGCRMIIITLGQLGTAFNDGKTIFLVPVPIEVTAVDTVGAGDAFIGALAYFISKYPNSSWFQKIGASMEIATHSVQFKGTQTSYINFPSIDLSTKSYNFEEIL